MLKEKFIQEKDSVNWHFYIVHLDLLQLKLKNHPFYGILIAQRSEISLKRSLKRTSVKIESLSNIINFSVKHKNNTAYLTQEQKDKIASIGITQKYEKKSKICKEGELASSMFILKSGELRRTIDGHEVGIVKPGDSFEEYAALNKNQNRRETITASEDS